MYTRNFTMKNKFHIEHRKTTYFFESVERIFWAVAGFVVVAILGYQAGAYFGFFGL